ncbi:MAG: helix-turn-helix domain-containing protein [bacterium]|nr:helix-turn-helix domain-containing protein [bacterium]
MRLTKEISEELLTKIERVIGRKAYLFDENGIAMDGAPAKIDLLALKVIQSTREITEKKEEKYFSCTPIVYEDKVIGAVCAGDDKKEDSLEFAGLAKGLAEVLLYEEFLVKNIHVANDLRSDFIKEILTGTKIQTTEEAVEQGDIIGVNLRFKYAVMIFKIDDLYQTYIEHNKKMRIETARAKFQEYLKGIEDNLLCSFEGEIQNCIVYIGDGKFVILKEIKGDGTDTLNSFKTLKDSGKQIYAVLKKKFPDRVRVSVGQYYQGLSGLRKSYEDSNIALRLGEKVLTESGVYHILDVAMFVGLLGDVASTRKNELSYQVLRKLYMDKDLLKTTSVFLENGMNLTEASKKLHLHRNTLIYRLHKVKELIGLDPTRFYDALQIKLGLMDTSEQGVPAEVN